MRLYLDEMFPPLRASMLRARDVDAISALDALPSGTPDEVHLLFAAQQGRCLVTKDLRDFGRLTAEFMEQQRPHAGLVLVPRSLTGKNYAALADALIAMTVTYPSGVPPYTILWLSSAPIP